jgi:2-dehydro-3-deoxyphosphogluconate aldolase / (4S)-4-hydroxy-2-oxoglutarate aldolase
MNVSQLLRISPVMPVVVIDDAKLAVPLARALVEGGIGVMEVTLRTAAALESIKAIARDVPEISVGAGTILNVRDLQQARDAGARFGISPGSSAELLVAGKDADWPYLPGAMTPSEVMAAVAAGYSTLKFFPAAQAGGVPMLKALAGPFPKVMFCPTGGISVATAPDYLALANVSCIGGSWLTPGDRIAAQDWAAITKLAREASLLRSA